MDASKARKPRPYWHVDAKWITGILLLLAVNVTLLALILVLATAPEQGITLLTTTLASSFSAQGGGLDEAGDIEIMKQKIAESPNGEWQPIPGMRIVVRAEDIAGMTPREMRLWFFRQWAEPIYYDGADGLASLATDPEMQSERGGGVGPLGFISAETHGKLKTALAVSGLISVVLLGLLVFFSHRFGRLGSPGCIVLLAAVPGLVLMSGARGWLEMSAQPAAAGGEETLITRYTQLAADVLPGVVNQAIQIFLALTLLGAVLMLVALVGAVFLRGRKHKEPAPPSAA